ncbi:MAG: class C sortase [Oscillospiraceae bacterium]|nr:class C sortase [Oscillospiraceae bacterium]
MKRKAITVLLIIIFLIGLSLLLYPTVSNRWNSARQTRAILDYSHAVEELSQENYEDLLNAAREYNMALASKSDRYDLSPNEQTQYMSLLNLDGTGAMGYVEIPKINVSMPIYHTTNTDVLQFAAGHIPGTSLPVGGEGTHCAVSGHRGLPSARLFTDLDKLQVGDVFTVNVLKNRLTYEVDRILIVEPENMEALEIEPGADLMTLVTCTPYGVNTHRLLVRGHRIDGTDENDAAYFASEAIQIEPVIVAPFVAIPFLALLLILMTAEGRKRSQSAKIKRNIRKEDGL